MPETRKKIGSEQLAADPHAVWNAFVELLATSDYVDLNAAQSPAHLVFMYESEVQNGGHLQYFLNRGTDHVHETIDALRWLNAGSHGDLLERAVTLWNSQSRQQPSDIYEYVEIAREGEFDDLDSAFYSSEIELVEVLAVHLAENEEEFIFRE